MPDHVAAWERLAGESSRAHSAFRAYRDAGPLRRLDDVPTLTGAAQRTVWGWSSRWSWIERARQWDDECHRVEDEARLEAIRTMHDTHQRAGRAAIGKAVAALAALQPADISAVAAARLLELGTTLERETLLVSVEEWQRQSPTAAALDDPWEAIARELQGS